MPKDRGYPDQFNLKGTMGKAGSKRLSEQPKIQKNVKGIGEAESKNRGLPGGPNGKYDVPGSNIQGSKSSKGSKGSKSY